MKKEQGTLLLLSALVISCLLTGCQAIGDIFKGGMWTGAILVILVIGLIVYFVGRGSKS